MAETKGWLDFQGLPGVNLERWTAFARWQYPELAVGVPAGLIAFSALAPDDPTSTAAWPSPLAWGVAVVTVSILVAIVYAWERQKRRRQRRARKMRWSWECTPGTRDASLSKVKVGQGVMTADVKLQGHQLSWDQLESNLTPGSGTALRGIYIDKDWGCANKASFTTLGYRSPEKKRGIILHFLPLGDPFSLPFYEEPADGARMMVGWSHAMSDDDDGKLWIDLDDSPHVAVRGQSGTGKGFLIRLLTIQALRAGWLVLLLDGGLSGEHAAGDCPTYWRPQQLNMKPADALQAAIDALEAVMAIVRLRNQIGAELSARGLAKSSRWCDFPDDLKAWQPRIGIVVDESSALLAKGNPELEPLRKKLRALLGQDVLRGGRKTGIHILPLADQSATLTTSLAHGDVAQAEHVIVLGNMDKTHARGATDLPSLPHLPDGIVKLAGFKLVRGDPRSVRELRLPPNGEPQLRNAAEWVMAA